MRKLIALPVVALATLLGCSNQIKSPIAFTSDIPHDVDPKIQQSLKNDIYALNEKFNEYSWKIFVAINWPTDKNGKPKAHFTDIGVPLWMSWKESFEVYRLDGKKPAPWGSSRTVEEIASGMVPIPVEAKNNSSVRVLLHDQKNTNIVDEEDQAFAGPLYDQQGNIVRYEILMNKDEFDYIVNNRLYNINGQINFTSKPDFQPLDFPKGDFNSDVVGAIEIKIAWKILTSKDLYDRYFTSESYVINNSTGEWEKKTLGMIGFHISQKTKTAKQWVWSTFEHIDNLRDHRISLNGKPSTVKASLRNNDMEILPANINLQNMKFHHNINGSYWQAENDKTKYLAIDNTKRTQAKRMVPIPQRVSNLNNKLKTYFASEKSVWQYYELIDTQYPLDQNALPGNTAKLPEGVTNKPGGNPNLALLTNITMETFFQAGNENADSLIEGNQPKNTTQIFGTESCMGCHSSAGLYKKGQLNDGKPPTTGQLSADFSWLLEKANWETGKNKNN